MGVRTGVIGYGLAGRVFHAPFVDAVPGLDLVAIVQRSGDEAARAYPRATTMRSVEELIASDVELIVVGTPNATHVPFARAALQAGKHVVIDKPMAPTSQEALELEAFAKTQGVLLAPFHNRRFDGDFLTLKRLLAEKRVGRPVTLRSRFDRFRPEPRANTWKEAEGPEHGLLMDLGPHVIDQALVLFGRPESVQASVRRDRDAGAVEDAFDLALTFLHDGDTLRVELGGTLLAADPQPRFLLQGTRGSYRKNGVDPQEPVIVAGAHVPPLGAEDDWLTEAESAWGTLTIAADPHKPTELVKTTVPTERGDYRRFYQGIADAITYGAEPPTTARDAVRVARIIELARESSRTGASIAVTSEDW